MSDENFSGGPVMIRIDGAKIRRIREGKGLTQLYLATAVEVTTDTVSRWENRRYPSIKKENGLRLAEALEVDLEEILEAAEPAAVAGLEPEDAAIPPAAEPPAAETAAIRPRRPIPRRLILALLTLAFLSAAALLLLLYRFQKQEPAVAVSARRIVPPHFIAGQPLPIFLHISPPGDQPVSIILKEELPPGTSVTFATPKLSAQPGKEHSLKWLAKLAGPAVFSYTAISPPDFKGQLTFSGMIKTGNGLTGEGVVLGDSSSTAGVHHWADINRDNRISDEEILAVYDLVSGDAASGIDMDQLEEMWLGDGYLWQPSEQRITIIE